MITRGISAGYLPQDGLSLSGRTVFAECMSVFSSLREMEQEMEDLTRKMSELDPASPEYSQVADRFHLTLNLRQAVERELAIRRPFLRFTPQSTPAVPTGGGREKENKRRQISIRSSVQQQHAEVARLRLQQKLELFQTIQRMKSAGMKVSQIARHLAINRRRIDRW